MNPEIEFVAVQLPSVPERIANVDRIERTLGTPIHRFEAIGALSNRWTQYPYCTSHARKVGGRPLKAGEIGCYASHLEILRRAATSGAQATVVIEDDAELKPGITAQIIRDRIAALPPRTDFVTTVRQENGHPEPTGDHLGWVRRYTRLPWGTSSLVIFPHTYRLLQPYLLPIAVPIDVFFDRATRNGHIRAYGPADPSDFWTCNGPIHTEIHRE